MSLAAALGQSRAGLSAVAVWAEATSSNIANADRPDYVRADVRRNVGRDGGLTGAHVARARSDALDAMLRTSSAREARQEAIAGGLALYAARLGQPGDPGTLGAELADLEAAFARLALAPEQAGRQRAALDAAEGFAGTLRGVSDALDEAEARLRDRVTASVAELNAGLRRVAADLEERGRADADGAPDAAIAAELGALAALADVRLDANGAGPATLHTPFGAILSEGGDAATVRFDAATGRLLADGLAGEVEITPGAPGARGFAEGRLAGEIEMLREILPRMRAQLDQLAGGLVAAFEASDGSLGPGDAGLFTDAGAPLGAGVTEGLAGRIAVNDLARPEAGGAAWRLRDGLGAIAPGPAGASAQAAAFADALGAARLFDPAAGLADQATLLDYAGALVTGQAGAWIGAEDRRDAFAARGATLAAARDAVVGVDLDAELQTLLRIEQSYAANSRVIQSLTQMFDSLLAAT